MYFCIKIKLMVKFIKRKLGLINIECWFSTKIDNKNWWRICFYRQCKENINSIFFKKEEFLTLLSDLSISQEEIYRKYSATVRNEINRAKRDEIIFSFDNSINAFVPFFNDFAQHKGLQNININHLSSYRKNLIITSAFKGESKLCSHSYVVDFELKRVRLYQSATLRFSDEIDHNLIGRANKYLHYQDMLKFKELGFEIYDWGGLAINSTDPGLIGINRFKSSFGGTEVIEYNYASKPYCWFISLKGILNR